MILFAESWPIGAFCRCSRAISISNVRIGNALPLLTLSGEIKGCFAYSQYGRVLQISQLLLIQIQEQIPVPKFFSKVGEVQTIRI